jgi:hypothetical protein
MDVGEWRMPAKVPNIFQTLPELVLLNVYGAPELMPRNEFRQPM